MYDVKIDLQDNLGKYECKKKIYSYYGARMTYKIQVHTSHTYYYI